MSGAAGPSSSSIPSVDPQTSALLASLHSSVKKSEANPKPLIKSTLHRVPKHREPATPKSILSTPSSDDVYEVTSWKTVEFAYRKAAEVGIGKDLPTLARGLFTVRQGDQAADHGVSDDVSGSSHDRIVVRGYDKFFNVGEISWTKVRRWL
jgi:tRNA ligase